MSIPQTVTKVLRQHVTFEVESNGHEYAKHQLERAGIAYEALDNDFLSCAAPARLQVMCDDKRAPGRFRTRIITHGVTPSLYVDYKHSRIKQCHKEGRTLPTETTVNDTRDFAMRKPQNWPPEKLTHLQ